MNACEVSNGGRYEVPHPARHPEAGQPTPGNGRPSDFRSGHPILDRSLAQLIGFGVGWNRDADNELWLDLRGWQREFPRATRHAGEDYFQRRRVSDFHFDPEAELPVARAAVQGTHRYQCTLTYEDGMGWMGDCTCPVEFDCKHLYALTLALAEVLAPRRPLLKPASPEEKLEFFPEVAVARPKPRPAVPADEQAFVAEFIRRTGAEPEKKQLSFLRNILAVHRNLRNTYYFDPRPLFDILPSSHRHLIAYPFDWFTDRWTKPPATPPELCSHLALVFEEHGIPWPAFMAPLTDLDAARRAIAGYRRERELDAWRARFGELEQAVVAAAEPAAPTFCSLRLRLMKGKVAWEISSPVAEPRSAATFQRLANADLLALIDFPERSASALDPASQALAGFIRRHRRTHGRSTPRLDQEDDCALLGEILSHPHARHCVVDLEGRALERSSRRLIWQFADHPKDPDVALVRLAFEDGAPAPRPLLHLPAKPDLYLHGNILFTGVPPPTDAAAAGQEAAVPRAALALPEAGRFAHRAGIALPGDVAGRFRRETLRARVRAWLAPRRPGVDGEVAVVELTAIAPDGTPRAIHENSGWRREGSGLPKPPPDAAFLVLDFEPTNAAVEHVRQLPGYWDQWHPEGPRRTVELGPGFTEVFPAWLAGLPKDTQLELAPELAGLAEPPTRAEYALEVAVGDDASGIDWFDVRVTLRAEDTTLTPEEIALLRQANGRFVRLPGRGWKRLVVAAGALDEKLRRIGLDPELAAGEPKTEPQRLHALQLADEALREALPERLWQRMRERAAGLRMPEPPAVPAGLTAELRPYQQEGFHFLAFLATNRFGGVLADDMGLGKTVQALAWFLWLAARGKKGATFRALVVCPKSVVVNWQLETTRFAPALQAAPLAPRAAAGPVPRDANIIVVNYAQLRLHAATLAGETWDAVVLDEGQNIKNPASVTAQAARDLKAAYRLVLTGTPIENRLLDLWSLFAFAMPGLLGGQAAFKRLYNDRQDPTGARSRLAHRVRHFMLRRTKAQVAQDLPPRIEEELVCELEGTQRTLYEAELKRARQLLLGVKSAREFDAQRFNILQSLLRLRQICCDPRLVGAGDEKGAGAASPQSAKLDALMETLEPLVAEGHKVLVFSQFVTMLELIRGKLNEEGIGHLILTGQTENRQQLVDQFQADATKPVFLLSLKAAGSGLNLTAASYVILYDPWWNPAVEAQAIDRTHRIGQRNQVIAYRLLARNTVEDKIRALQREKSALAAAVVQEETLARVLDLDSLREILA